MKTNEKVVLLGGGVVLAAFMLQVAIGGTGGHGGSSHGSSSGRIIPGNAPRPVSGWAAETLANAGNAGGSSTDTSGASDPGDTDTSIDAPDAPSAPIAVEGSGSAVGVAIWVRDLPDALPALALSEDKTQGCCPAGEFVDPTDRSLLVSDDGKVANVVVFLDPVQGDAVLTPPSEPIVLDQHKCRFEPHVMAIPVGTTVRYANSDSINHNVHTSSRKNPSINRSVAPGGHIDVVLDLAEPVTVKCDVHPWMDSFIYVADAYSAVSDLEGNLRFDDIPAGEYRVSWWHESEGKGKAGNIVITDGGEAAFEVEIKKGR